MEIKLNVGDKITIPTGCKATIEDKQIIIEEKQEEFKEEFKDGDILISKVTNNNINTIVIFSNYREYKSFFDSYNSINSTNSNWLTENFRHTTEEEKQKFFDELKAKGLRWNAETKEMERIRVRVKYGDLYLNVSTSCEVIEARECCDSVDNKRWEVGNYYLLSEREQAEEDVKALKAIFKKRLKI